MIKILPSILAADFARLGAEARRMEEAGADMLHCDIMDGHFVPNLSFGPPVVEALRRCTSLPLDVHIMANSPEWMLPVLKDAGAACVTLHVEAVNHLHRALGQIRALGMKAGVTLNPATPVEALEWVLPEADLVMVMTVNPGFGGQKLIPQTVDKLRRVREKMDALGSRALLVADGGVTPETAPLLCGAGATALVAGNMLFTAPDAGEAIAALRRVCEV